MYRVGIDIGGTFTDVTALDKNNGTLVTHKEPTTPDDPSLGAFSGLKTLLHEQRVGFTDVEEVVHGTTLVSNTIIEKTGATTGLVTTAGTRDVLGIRRSLRFDLFDWHIEEPRPLVPRNRRVEIDERLDADGAVRTPIDRAEVGRAVRTLVVEHDVDSIAVSLLHSYTSSEHEEVVKGVVDETYPSVYVTLSSRVAPIIREFERTSTTVVNGYVLPVIDNYLDRFEQRLRSEGFRGSLYLMTSSGGIVSTETARREPVRLVSSGPAAGVLLSRKIGRAVGAEGVFSFDMGGTTAKGGIVEAGEIPICYEDDIGRTYRFKKGSGYTVSVPLIELSEIGAGGGSIATVDGMGMVNVGPESAGSRPGPVCYGRGGEKPTVTDAALLLGFIDEEGTFGGEIDVDRTKAEKVFDERIATPLDISLERAALEVFEVVTENMSNAFRQHATEKGVDPHELTMIAQGGAGPMTAFRVAATLGIDEIICPLGAGVGSSIGLIEAPKLYESTRTKQHLVSDISLKELTNTFDELHESAKNVLLDAGASTEDLTPEFVLGMRHANQGAEIQVALPVDSTSELSFELLERRFRETYENLYHRPALDHPVEILDFRVKLKEDIEGGEKTIRHAPVDVHRDTREVYFGTRGWVTADVRNRAGIEEDRTVGGPAIVQSEQTTVVVDPESTYTLKNNRIHVRRRVTEQ